MQELLDAKDCQVDGLSGGWTVRWKGHWMERLSDDRTSRCKNYQIERRSDERNLKMERLRWKDYPIDSLPD